LQGADPIIVEALSRGETEIDEITDAEKALLQLAHRLTLHPTELEEDHVRRVREAGWSDEQIAEAVYVISLFAFYNRVAHAFGLEGANHGKEELDKL
jgi:alkylhydroperoxidase family enzyme